MLGRNMPGFVEPKEAAVTKAATKVARSLKGQAFAVGIVIGFLLCQFGHLLP